MPVVSIPELLRRFGLSDAEVKGMSVPERLEELTVQYFRMLIDQLPPGERERAEHLFTELLGIVLPPWKRPLYLTCVEDTPPTLVLFGTADRLKPQGDEFVWRAKEVGYRAELFTAEDQPHGFFNRPPWFQRTTDRMDEFLTSLGYLTAANAVTGKTP
jgi:acetyl esterase/lipase